MDKTKNKVMWTYIITSKLDGSLALIELGVL